MLKPGGKGKVHPTTNYEGTEGEYRHSFLLISALDGDGWLWPRPGQYTPGEYPSTHCIGGWVGSQAG